MPQNATGQPSASPQAAAPKSSGQPAALQAGTIPKSPSGTTAIPQNKSGSSDPVSPQKPAAASKPATPAKPVSANNIESKPLPKLDWNSLTAGKARIYADGKLVAEVNQAWNRGDGEFDLQYPFVYKGNDPTTGSVRRMSTDELSKILENSSAIEVRIGYGGLGSGRPLGRPPILTNYGPQSSQTVLNWVRQQRGIE